MPITVYIEVAIGIVFVWLFLAMAVMAIQEWVAAALKTRGRDMQATIRAMLEDPKAFERLGKGTKTIVDQIYEHPRIQSLRQPFGRRRQPKDGVDATLKRRLPSYIPTRTFSLALFDVIATAGTPESTIQKTVDAWTTTVEATVHSLKANGTLPPEVEAKWQEIQPVLSSEIGEITANLDTSWTGEQLRREVALRLRKAKAALEKGPWGPVIDQFWFAVEKLPERLLEASATRDRDLLDSLDSWKAQAIESIDGLEANEKSRPEKTIDWAKDKQTLLVALDELIAVVEHGQSESELASTIKLKIARLKVEHPQVAAAFSALKPLIDELPQYLLSQQVIKGVATLAGSNPQAQKMLEDIKNRATAAAAKGEDMIAAFRSNAETWFDEVMARASGWYKRKAIVFSAIWGLVVAVLLNIDSLAVVSTLYTDPTTRAAIVAEAGAMQTLPEQGDETEQPQETLDKTERKLSKLGLPVGWTFAGADTCAEFQASDTPMLSWYQYVPLWKQEVWESRCIVPANAANLPSGLTAYFWPVKVVGWLLSGAMAAQGAPFWFDIMKKLINVRNTGTNPTEERAKKEAQSQGKKAA
jgi:hypothetical protein